MTPPDPAFIVTRPSPDHGRLMSELGCKAIHSPAFELLPEAKPRLASTIARLRDFDMAIVTSPFAARMLAEMPVNSGIEHIQFLAPGRGTASLLRSAGSDARFPVAGGTSEHLLDMAELQQVRKKRIAIVGAPGGRGLLSRELSERGARVESVHIYRRKALPPASRLVDALGRGDRLVVFISSLQAFNMIQASLPDELRCAWRNGQFVVSSPRIERACLEAGVRRVRLATGAADDQMLAAAVDAGWLRPPAD